ncbi:MAG TPA: AI-2E family transporter [Candidatus Nanoarchaeia archaeon]|nr:AI-2E family transporter [Candidatus Nanoarchaeia archaeon]
MEDEYIKKIITVIILISLLVLSFFILKPIILSVVWGFILAFIFMPVYNFLYKKTKRENLSAIIICVLLAILIILPLWFLTPIIINQSVKIYIESQQLDIVTPLKEILPSVFASEQFSVEVGSIIESFITKVANSLVTSFSQLILNFPALSLQFLVALFSFYFVLRDKEKLIAYIKSFLPFSKDVEKKLFNYTQSITYSVLYGQFIIGIIQGAIAGIGFFVFKAPNALLLTILAIAAGIFPIIGTSIVWVPVVIYLFIAGNTTPAVGIAVMGVISANIDIFLRPLIVSKNVNMNSSIVLIGMIGGLFSFGILGFILGPLILAYLLIILEIYRDKRIPGVFIQTTEQKK